MFNNGLSERTYSSVEIIDPTIDNQGFYVLTTLSIYNSKYKGSDNIERNTAWAGGFVGNLVGGKEFVFKSIILSFN